MRRALVIYGDREIGGAIADGIVPRHTDSEAVRRVAMHQHTPEEWAAMIERARYEYGQERKHGRLYEIVWGVIGSLVLAVNGWYGFLAEWNREG
jgi:hypothetical protein